MVAEGFEEVGALVNDDVVLDVGVFLILDLEVVRGELGDREVGATDSPLVADDVGGLGDLAVQKVVHVGFVSLHDQMIQYTNSPSPTHLYYQPIETVRQSLKHLNAIISSQ